MCRLRASNPLLNIEPFTTVKVPRCRLALLSYITGPHRFCCYAIWRMTRRSFAPYKILDATLVRGVIADIQAALYSRHQLTSTKKKDDLSFFPSIMPNSCQTCILKSFRAFRLVFYTHTGNVPVGIILKRLIMGIYHDFSVSIFTISIRQIFYKSSQKSCLCSVENTTHCFWF